MRRAWTILGLAATGLLLGSGPRSIVEVDERGATFPSAPWVTASPAYLEEEEPAELRDVQRHLRAGDPHHALKAAQELVSRKEWGRDRTAAWFTIGMLHREAGRHNLASEAFTKVRLTRGPMAPFGAYYEAEQDLMRGKPGVAVHECKAYQKKWPDGPHVDACSRVIARGHAARGHAVSARKAAEEYDEEHEETPIEELVLVTLARQEMRNNPEKAVWRLKELWRDHESPLTGRLSEQWLRELQEKGVKGAEVPNDTASLQSRAVSLRAAGAADEAWAVYEELGRRAQDDVRLQAWVDDQAHLFGWYSKRYDFLAEVWGAKYKEEPNGETAWDWYRGLARAAKWSEAGDVGLKSLKKHGGSREWRRKHEDVARTLMLAKRYEEARDTFDTVRRWGGWRGRRGQFYAAFSAYMNRDHEDALKRFDEIIERDRSYVTEAHYWRAKTLDAVGRSQEAAVSRAAVLERDPLGWYAINLSQQDLPSIKPFARDGSWPGLGAPGLPAAPAAHVAGPAPTALWAAPRTRTSTAFNLLTWPMAPVAPVQAVQETVLHADPFAPPPSYRDGAMYTEAEAKKDFRRFARRHGKDWPVLGAIYDLASAGMYDLSGPLMSKFYEDWKHAWRYTGNPKHDVARKIEMRQQDWRELFFYARDHHHTTRFTYGLDEKMDDPAVALEVKRYIYPLAHARYVWEHGEEHGLDPYLVMGLMRQESKYDAIAVSRVGARGAMQIMPRTGYLLANLAGDTDFTAGDLEDPILSIERGITYLGLLMRRFDGAYPLAVAAYNGGPHNVSRFTKGTGTDMPMDEYVEHIPFRETRRYVKGVSSSYATYLSLYTDRTSVVLPRTPRGDHPEVVDF